MKEIYIEKNKARIKKYTYNSNYNLLLFRR